MRQLVCTDMIYIVYLPKQMFANPPAPNSRKSGSVSVSEASPMLKMLLIHIHTI